VTKRISQISPEQKSLNEEEVVVLREPSVQLKIYDERTIGFLDDVSKAILNSPQLNRVPEMAALGFWFRRAHISGFIKENSGLVDSKSVKINPLGIVFHVCPSNVETMFMYSCALALLMGNRSLVRVSQRQHSPYLDSLFAVFNTVLAKESNAVFRSYISIVTYGHDDSINEFFSMHADARIIWGGDETIEKFKAFKTSPRTKDILFADRVSYSVFSSGVFLTLSEKEKSELASKFYNDSYSFNQKGCSCPQAIFILGKNKDNELFRKEFYESLETVVRKKYNGDLYSLASLKLNQVSGDALQDKISSVYGNDNRVVFADLIREGDASGTCGGGLFYTKYIEEIEDLLPYIHPKVQTVGYFGLEEKEIELLSTLAVGRGMDRLVPVGTALDFHYLWDGYNLFEELCCKRYIG
jgi:hypothetical protein